MYYLLLLNYTKNIQNSDRIIKSGEMNINFVIFSRDDEERTKIDPRVNRMTGFETM